MLAAALYSSTRNRTSCATLLRHSHLPPDDDGMVVDPQPQPEHGPGVRTGTTGLGTAEDRRADPGGRRDGGDRRAARSIGIASASSGANAGGASIGVVVEVAAAFSSTDDLRTPLISVMPPAASVAAATGRHYLNLSFQSYAGGFCHQLRM